MKGEMKHVALLLPTLDRLAGAERQVLLLAHGFGVGRGACRWWRLPGTEMQGARRSAMDQTKGGRSASIRLKIETGSTLVWFFLVEHRVFRPAMDETTQLVHALWRVGVASRHSELAS